MTTRTMGEPIVRREDPRLVAGEGRFLDDLGPGALAAAFVRSPHAHARVLDVDVSRALEVEGLVAIYTYEDLEGPVAEPLPLLIPHPSLHAPRTAYPLANGVVRHVGEPVAMVVARDRYLAEDACERIAVAYEPLATGGRPGGGRGRRAEGPRRRARQRRRPHGPGARRRPGRRGRRPPPPRAGPDHRAVRLHAHGGPGRLRPLGRRRPVPARLHLDPDLDLGPVRPGGQAGGAGGPGRGDRPRRRRRLRGQDRPPLARGGPGPLGRDPPGPRGQVGRGPPRALHRRRPRARPAPPRQRRLRRRRPPARPGRRVPARQRRLHAVRDHRPHHHRDPARRPLQAGRLPGRVPLAVHQHRDRHPLPGRRPAPGGVRDGADHGRDRRLPGPRPGRGPPGQLHPALRDAVRPPPHLPGRAAAGLRLRRLPGHPGEGEEAGRLGRVRGLPGRGPARPGGGSGSAWPATSRAPGSARTRARTCGSRPTARWWWPPG